MAVITRRITVAVDNTADVLCAASSSRQLVTLTNNGGVNVYVGGAGVLAGDVAQAEGGAMLSANGGTRSYTGQEAQGAISGITSAGASVVSVEEGF